MIILGKALIWILAGIGLAWLHLVLLRRAIDRVMGLSAHQAKKRLVRGLPLRLLVLCPVMVLSAKAGLLACAGLIVGLLLGRWLAWHLAISRGQSATVSSTRG